MYQAVTTTVNIFFSRLERLVNSSDQDLYIIFGIRNIVGSLVIINKTRNYIPIFFFEELKDLSNI